MRSRVDTWPTAGVSDTILFVFNSSNKLRAECSLAHKKNRWLLVLPMPNHSLQININTSTSKLNIEIVKLKVLVIVIIFWFNVQPIVNLCHKVKNFNPI